MATYKGQDIAMPDVLDELLRLYGNGMQKPSNGPPGYEFGFEDQFPGEVPRKPGQKNYLHSMPDQMAANRLPGRPPEHQFSNDAGYVLASTPAAMQSAAYLRWLHDAQGGGLAGDEAANVLSRWRK